MKNILIIEDDSTLQGALNEIFTSEGYTVVGCASAHEAFESIKVKSPDVIVTDLVLPNVDGFEIIKTIRENVHLGHVPILVLSNLGQEENIEKAMSLGANEYMVKSNSSLKDITDKVKGMLG